MLRAVSGHRGPKVTEVRMGCVLSYVAGAQRTPCLTLRAASAAEAAPLSEPSRVLKYVIGSHGIVHHESKRVVFLLSSVSLVHVDAQRTASRDVRAHASATRHHSDRGNLACPHGRCYLNEVPFPGRACLRRGVAASGPAGRVLLGIAATVV